MASPTLLTGGTGMLGRLVAPLLQQAGCELRMLSRQSHRPRDGLEFVVGDLATGDGLPSAVDGIGTIVHCAGSAKGDDEKARHLVRAAAPAGIKHLVFISVVGADRIPVLSAIDRVQFGYFAAKHGAEQAIEKSGLPWTTLRATQFYDAILNVVRGMAKLPVIPVPSVQFQPVAAEEVAARLTQLSIGPPTGLAPAFAGPHVYTMKELLRSYLSAAGKHRLTIPIRPPGNAARAIRAGANLAPENWASPLTVETSPIRRGDVRDTTQVR